MAMPTVREAPWQSQLTPKPAHCPHAACRFSSASGVGAARAAASSSNSDVAPREWSRRCSRRSAHASSVRSASVVTLCDAW
eukprot:scaffold126169_cov42-Phaeocystis_antarctica.AAC.1